MTNHDYSAIKMKMERDEIKDRQIIKQSYDYFALINEILEIINDG